MGRLRRAAALRHRAVLGAGRSRDGVPAEARAAVRRRVQRVQHVRRPAAGRLHGDGRAPLRRSRDGRDDGLCRQRRFGEGAARDGRGGLHRRRERRHGALLRQRGGLRHHAARAGGLRRHDGARGGNVPRVLSRRTGDRAGRLFRPRGERFARRRGAVSRPRRRRTVARAGRHARRALRRGAGHGGLVRRARAARAARGAHLPERNGAAPARRHRRQRGGDLPPARGAGRPGLRQGGNRRQLGLRPRQVQGVRVGRGAGRRHRHRLVPARAVDGNLRHRRHRRLRRPGVGQGRPRVPASRRRRG